MAAPHLAFHSFRVLWLPPLVSITSPVFGFLYCLTLRARLPLAGLAAPRAALPALALSGSSRAVISRRDFSIYSGDDPTACALILMGAQGNISVVANVAPRLMHEMCVAALAGDLAKARELHFRLQGLHRQLFCEANPIPVKWACQQLGLIPEGGIRLPLTPLSADCHERVRAALRQAGVLA